MNGIRENFLSLDVPLLGQIMMLPFDSGDTYYHGSGNCWWAAMRMIAYYFKSPLRGIPRDAWIADEGLGVYEFSRLGFFAVIPLYPITSLRIFEFLKKYGPLLAVGKFFDNNADCQRSHCIVITGIDGDIIIYNDPGPPKRARAPISWLRMNLLNQPPTIFCYDPQRYSDFTAKLNKRF